MDTAVWLAGRKDDSAQGQPSLAQQTIEALREAGLLDDIMVTKEGLVVYPANLIQMNVLPKTDT
ncbi:MAG: hypothetical protein M5U34_37075 [Chloroflexi bacterium]|nr:hypothetical protein [Chloroflexota bacterium]